MKPRFQKGDRFAQLSVQPLLTRSGKAGDLFWARGTVLGIHHTARRSNAPVYMVCYDVGVRSVLEDNEHMRPEVEALMEMAVKGINDG